MNHFMDKSLSDSNSKNRTMTLTGQGKISLVPNIAVIRLGVQITGDNLVAIQSENAKKTQAILQALQSMGISDVKTFQYTIDKIYDYEEGKQIDKGYSVRNILEIKTGNIDQAGAIIDNSVNIGANVVDFISFEVSDSEYFYQQALNLAMTNAIHKAKFLAMNLGIKVDPIPVSIVENSSMSMPLQEFKREFASTPIVPGNIQIEALVTVEFVY